MGNKKRTDKRISDLGFKLENMDDIKEHGFVLIDEHQPIINHRIEEIVKKKGIKTSDIAKLTGIARQSMNTIKKYKSKPPLEFALKMAYILDVRVEDMFQLNEAGWIYPLKSSNDSGYYYDNLNDEVIFSSDKSMRIKANKFEYFEPNNPNKKYTKAQANRIMNRSNYKGGLRQIYQRIGVEIEPYQFKG